MKLKGVLFTLGFSVICHNVFTEGKQLSHCVNLASGKQANQSSTLNFNGYDWNAKLALDGNKRFSESCKCCSATNGTETSWWEVDLGAMVTVDRVEVFGRPTHTPNQLFGFELFASERTGKRDQSTKVYTNNVTDNTYNTQQGHFIIYLKSKRARFISIQLYPNSDGVNRVLTICEILVFQCDIVPINEPIIASSTLSYWNTTWSSAVDNSVLQDADVCNCCASTEKKQQTSWVDFNLRQPYKIKDITVYGRNDGKADTLQNVRVFIDTVEIMKGQRSVDRNDVIVIPDICNVGQHVRLQMDHHKYLLVCEVLIKQQLVSAYGENCTPCGHCKNNFPCDSWTGECKACDSGYKMPYCATSCDKGTYGNCTTRCGNCYETNNCDTVNGRCPNGCDAGYQQPLCDKDCPIGTYGNNCQQKCGQCKDNVTCNVINGSCPQGCAPGYEGALCNGFCKEGTYGDCHTPCGHCKEKDKCNFITGDCSRGCAPGYKGHRCDTACDSGTYGDCQTSCGHCKDNYTCYFTNGTCPNDCAPGYTEERCDKVCSKGYYGDCQTPCGHCKDNVTCSFINGLCPDICDPGYKGKRCDTVCVNGTYGDCNARCGQCKNRDVCDFVNGSCPNGCSLGYEGEQCNSVCSDYWYGEKCSYSCGHCLGNASCNHVNGHCTRCVPGFQGRLCKDMCGKMRYGENCLKNCTNCKNDTCNSFDGNCTLGCMYNFQGARCDIRAEEQAGPKSSETTIIASVTAVVGVVVVIFIVVVVLLFIRRRHVQMNNKPTVYENQLNVFDNTNTAVYAQPSRGSVETTYAKPVKTNRKAIETLEERNKISGKESETTDEMHDYYSFEPRENDLKIHRLWSYIQEKKEDSCKLFYDEFNKLKKGLVEKHDKALDPVNRPKNRYREMYAYDDTRVVLEIDEEGATDYINACFIHGQERPTKFIASQGPIKDMDVDFWRMVWQQNSSLIVMLTNLYEIGGEKCKKYWPNPDEDDMFFGKIKVKCDSEHNRGDFVIRKLKVCRGSDAPRTVTQYHFRAWPDKDVPDTTWCLVNFWRRVMVDDRPNKQKHRPIVVHCSAGIGRTGTFIALDNLYNQAKTEGCLRPFQMVESLRKQRVNMVQTKEQYVFLHEAVADALLIGTHHILVDQYKDVYNYLIGVDPDTRKARMQIQYELMVEILKDQLTRHGSVNEYSNIYSSVNGDTTLARNGSSWNEETGLNITFMPESNNEKAFVVINKPTKETLDDFWSFVEENKIKTFVIAKDSMDSYDKTISWLGTESKSGSFSVNIVGKRTETGYQETNVSFNRRGNDEASLATIRQFELNSWEDSSVPSDPVSVIKLYEGIRCWQSHLKNTEPLLIYCRKGSERSGLLYTALSMLFKFGAGNDDTKFNILAKVMQVKQRDMSFIPNFEQYRFIHDVILKYISQNEASEDQVYVNYKE